jgi:ubiquitin-conjugating enzyme E2 O
LFSRPGDHVVWKNEEGVSPAIVQSVNATDRTALILLPDTGTIELAPLLELDPHGNHENDANTVHNYDGFGVRRGDFVFIHKPGTSNGLERPKVPRIGEIEAWVRENSLDGMGLTGWRKEMHHIGYNVAADSPAAQLIKRPVNGDGKLSWCGEVTGVCPI